MKTLADLANLDKAYAEGIGVFLDVVTTVNTFNEARKGKSVPLIGGIQYDPQSRPQFEFSFAEDRYLVRHGFDIRGDGTSQINVYRERDLEEPRWQLYKSLSTHDVWSAATRAVNVPQEFKGLGEEGLTGLLVLMEILAD